MISYAAEGQVPTFKIPDEYSGLFTGGTQTEINYNGLKRIEYTFTVNDPGHDANGHILLETSDPAYNEYFYIYVSTRETDNHFDIEISDGGTYKLKKTETTFLMNDGQVVGKTVKTTMTEYAATVSGVNRRYIFDKDGNLYTRNGQKGYISSGEYTMNGDPSNPSDTQFEYTSAYRTDGEGHLMNYEGQLVPNSGKVPEYRNYEHDLIGSVVFNLNLYLQPKKRMEKTETFDANGIMTGSEPFQEVDVNALPDEEVRNVPVKMWAQAIIDAYNKCPNHLRLDFTLSDTIYAAEVTPAVSKNLKVNGAEEYFNSNPAFNFDVYTIDPTKDTNIQGNPDYYLAMDPNGEIKFEPVTVIGFDPYGISSGAGTATPTSADVNETVLYLREHNDGRQGIT